MAARFQADFGIAGIAFGSQLSFLICLLYIQHSLMCLLLGGFGLWNVKAYIVCFPIAAVVQIRKYYLRTGDHPVVCWWRISANGSAFFSSFTVTGIHRAEMSRG